MPIVSSAGGIITLEIISINSINIAPSKADAGIKNL